MSETVEVTDPPLYRDSEGREYYLAVGRRLYFAPLLKLDAFLKASGVAIPRRAHAVLRGGTVAIYENGVLVETVPASPEVYRAAVKRLIERLR